MPTCPNGHRSGTEDWCEVCGHRMSSAGAASPSSYGHDPDATAAVEMCPQCNTPREGIAFYCEDCRYNFGTRGATTYAPPAPPFPPYQRYESRPSRTNRAAEPILPTPAGGDFLLSPPPEEPVPAHPQAAPAGWSVVVAADRDYYVAMMSRSGPDGQGLRFPQFSPEQRLALTGSQVSIGRRRHGAGEAPDIDLSRSPEDPGVSHHHAVLLRQPDGAWCVIDQDSTNGTTVNGAEESVLPFSPVPLRDGDRVHVGAWTTITITADRAWGAPAR